MSVMPEGTGGEERPRRRRWGVGLTVASVGLVVGAWATWMAASTGVEYVRIDYQLTAPDECDGTLYESGVWDSVEIEIWGPNTEGLSRVKLSYPNDTSEWAIVENLSAFGVTRVWLPRSSEEAFGSVVLSWVCLNPAGQFSAPPDRMLDQLGLSVGWFISIDGSLPGSDEQLVQAITARGDPVGMEMIGGIESTKYTFTDDPDFTAQGFSFIEFFSFTDDHGFMAQGFSFIESFWIDETAARLQKGVWEFQSPDGLLARSLTASERGRVRVDFDFFRTEDLVIHYLNT
jgi:hypothetical protein